MFRRTKQLIKTNTLLKEELLNLKRKYEKKEQEIEDLNELLNEMNMGYLLFSVVLDEAGMLTDLTIEYANDAVLKSARVEEDEFLYEPVSKALPSLSENLIKVSAEAMATGNRTSFIEYDEIEDHYIKVICYEAGVDRCACVLWDITDSFFAEKLLEHNAERYRSVCEASEEYIFELNLNGQFTYINEGIRRMLGYEPEEFLGKYYYEQYPIDVRKHTAHMFQKCFNECGQEIHGLMTELLGKDGRHHYAIQNGIVLMDEDGNDIGYRGIYFDVTALQKSRKKAEEAVSAKTELFTKMSHEIRTPLNGMIGLTSLALDEPRTYKVYQYLQRIEESAMDLLEIINTVLDYSKISEDEIRLYEEAFSLQLVIKKVTSLLLLKAQEKNIKLLVEVEDHVPDTYSGDRLRLGQILTNLLSNAIKYTQEGYVKLIVRKRDKGLLFIIKDTGIGMKEELINHIFEPLKKDQEIRNGKVGGNGLGMIISKQLIEAMEGRIKIFSKANEGTKVYVALPLNQCQEDLVRSTEIEFEKSKKVHRFFGNVLVVEDNSTSQIVVCDLLEKFGVSVATAKDGDRALSLVRSTTYDIIFMDVFLPKRSGFEISKRMREDNVETPIIAMTANPFETIKQEFEKSKMNDYLTKPLNIYKIEYILQKYLPIEEGDVLTACTVEEESAQDEVPVYPFKHIDYRAATAQLDYEDALYNRIVFSFIEEYQEDSTKFQDLVKTDPKAARVYIHTMKGAAQTLGAMELSALARQLEEMLLDGKVDKGLVGMYSSELRAVLKEVTAYAESIMMQMYTEGYQEEKAVGLIKKLQNLLETHSAAAVDLVAEIYGTLYREDLVKQVDTLVNQIEHYEFELARSTLGAIKESLGVKV